MIKNTAPDQLAITEVVPAYTTIGVLHNLGRDRDIVGRAVFVGGNLATKHLGDSPNTLIDALTPNTTYTFKIGRYDSMSSDSLIAAGFDIDFSTEETVTTKIYPAIAGHQVVAEYVEIGAAPPALDIQLTGDADTVEIEYKATNGQWLPAWYGEFGEKIHVTGLPLGTLDLRVRGVIDIPVAPYKEKSPWLPINGVVMKSTFQAPAAAAAPTTQVSKLAEPTERYDVKVSWTWARGTGSDIRHFILERLDTTLHGTDWAKSEKINTGTAKSYTIVNHPFEREFKYRVTAVSWGPEDLNSTISPETALTITSATTIVDLVRDTNLEVNYAHIKATASIDGSPKQTFLLDAATGSLALGKLDAQGNAPVSVDGTNGDVHIDGKVITESIYSANFILTNTTGASNPSLHSISKPTYTDTSTGVYMGHQNDGSFRFNMGNAANYIKWNGTSLDIKGKVTISGGSTGFSELLDAPTSLGELNAAEGSKLSGIAAGADVTNYTAISEDAQAKVDAVEVGGRNLLLGTSNSEVGPDYEFYAYKDLAPIFEEFGLVEYTISVELRTPVPGNINIYSQNGSGTRYGIGNKPCAVTTEWQRFTHTFVPTSGNLSETRAMVAFYGTYGTGRYIKLRRFKIEKGNKATDWTPSPEDVEAYTDAQALAAEQAAKNYADQTFVDATSYGQDIAQIQTQIDKSITSWFEDGVPTLSNAPASSWATDADKDVHLGDLYYDNLTGYSYRFKKSGSVYSWGKISDSDVTAALTAAANAQDTADGKRRVFYETPVVPYDKGDLWDTGNGLKRATANVATGGSYSSSHWLDVTDGAGAADAAQQAAIDAAALDASSKVDAVEVGGRNYFSALASKKFTNGEFTLADYQGVGSFTQFYNLTAPMSQFSGSTVVISFDVISPNGAGTINVYNTNSNPRYLLSGSTTYTSINDSWQRMSLVFNVVDRGESYSDGASNKVEFYSPQQLGVKIRNVKLEKGNKATDWTPSPEDVEADAQAKADAAQAVALAESALVETRANAYADGIVSPEERTAIANAQTAVDVALAKQQAIDAAALDASSKVDAVEVGGRNLVLNSGVGWVSSGYSLFGYTYSSPPLGSIEYTVSLKGDLTDASQTGFYVNVTDNVNGYPALAVLYESDKNAQGVYVKTVIMPEMPQDIVRGYVYAYPLGLYKEASVDWIKIEKGNKATDWTPAPEDVEADAQNKANTAENNAKDHADYSEENGVTRIARPAGATYSSDFYTVSGAFKIRLPQRSTNTTLKFTVDIYNYSTGKTVSIDVSGYNFVSGGKGWFNCTAVTHASSSVPIRFGNDGVKDCIWIGNVTVGGDTATSWSFPRVSVRDLTAGRLNSQASKWKSGWEITLVSALGTVDHTFYDTHSDVTKTVIDGGLITTGGIKLDGTSGYIRAGKTSFTDMQNPGFWLGQTTAGAAINIGDVNEYMYFRGDTGLRLKTTDLEIGAGGAASFSGSINTSDGRFKTARSGNTVNGAVANIDTSNGGGLRISITTPIPASGAIHSGVSILSSGLPGLYSLISNTSSEHNVISAQTFGSGAGVFGSSSQGAGLHGATSGAWYSVSSSALKLETSGAPHIRCVVSTAANQYIPYGKKGDIKAVENADGVTNFAHCYESTADNKGKWANSLLIGNFNGGDLSGNNSPAKMEIGSVYLGGNRSTTVTLPKKVLIAFSSTRWGGGDESDGSSISWSGNTISIRNSTGASRTVMYMAITI